MLAEHITYGDSHFPFGSPYASNPVRYAPGLCPQAEWATQHHCTFWLNERYTEEDIADAATAIRKVAETYASRREP
jgi:hypothetical protein